MGRTQISRSAAQARQIARRNHVVRHSMMSLWNDVHRDGRLPFTVVIADLGRKGVFDLPSWDSEEETPEQYLEASVVACLDNRQTNIGELFGIPAALCFEVRHGSVFISGEETSDGTMNFGIASAAHPEQRYVALSFPKSDGAWREDIDQFLMLITRLASLRKAESERLLRIYSESAGLGHR